MAEASDIALWITQLADADPAKRAAAARAAHRAAFTECFSESNDWIHDPEFLELTRPFEPLFFVVGIAVRPETFERIRLANAFPRLAEVPKNQDAIEFELHFGGEGDLDILTTCDLKGSGAIARYLEKFGEGIQQVEVNVSDVDRATALLSARFGIRPIYPTTQAGADHTRVNFFLLPAARGRKCLIELVEPASK